jgi:membrane protease YdiL (CAAX protease family)
VGRRAALAALAIMAALMAARHEIYARMPATKPCASDPECPPRMRALFRSYPYRPGMFDDVPIFDPAAWSRRDNVMDLPRAAAFLACLAAMAALGGLGRWGWTGKWTAAGAGLLAAAGLGFMLGDAGMGARTFARGQIAAGIGSTFFVVLWEETCFRGLLYRGLRDDLSPAAAAILSSAAFMVMHWQAQGTESWPWIFCYGVLSCAALEDGAGLIQLFVVHWIVDSAYFFTAGMDGPGAASSVGHLLLASAAAGSVIRLIRRSSAKGEWVGARRE